MARIVPTTGASFGAVVGPEAWGVRFIDDAGEFNPDDVMLARLIRATRLRRAVFPINVSAGYGDRTEEDGGSVEISRSGTGNVAMGDVAIRAAEIRAALAPSPTAATSSRLSRRPPTAS